MKTLTRSILLIFVLMLLPGCAITHKYGPYMGKVVDKETGEPIAGAVVFIQFYTEGGLSPGGAVGHYADAAETLTNEKGEYYLPPVRIVTFRIGDNWNNRVYSIIFKPGYGAYPGHPGSSDGRDPMGWLREGVPDTIQLPKLKTSGERGKNAGDGLSFNRSRVPYEKYELLFGAVNEERIFVGSKPLPDPRQFPWSK